MIAHQINIIYYIYSFHSVAAMMVIIHHLQQVVVQVAEVHEDDLE